MELSEMIQELYRLHCTCKDNKRIQEYISHSKADAVLYVMDYVDMKELELELEQNNEDTEVVHQMPEEHFIEWIEQELLIHQTTSTPMESCPKTSDEDTLQAHRTSIFLHCLASAIGHIQHPNEIAPRTTNTSSFSSSRSKNKRKKSLVIQSGSSIAIKNSIGLFFDKYDAASQGFINSGMLAVMLRDTLRASGGHVALFSSTDSKEEILNEARRLL
jgi:hypothetical protein